MLPSTEKSRAIAEFLVENPVPWEKALSAGVDGSCADAWRVAQAGFGLVRYCSRRHPGVVGNPPGWRLVQVLAALIARQGAALADMPPWMAVKGRAGVSNLDMSSGSCRLKRGAHLALPFARSRGGFRQRIYVQPFSAR